MHNNYNARSPIKELPGLTKTRHPLALILSVTEIPLLHARTHSNTTCVAKEKNGLVLVVP